MAMKAQDSRIPSPGNVLTVRSSRDIPLPLLYKHRGSETPTQIQASTAMGQASHHIQSAIQRQSITPKHFIPLSPPQTAP